MTENWRDQLPKPKKGYRWEVDTGVYSRLRMVHVDHGYRHWSYYSGIISAAPNNFLEPFYMWTRADKITIKHLRRTAKRILAGCDVTDRRRAAESRWK